MVSTSFQSRFSNYEVLSEYIRHVENVVVNHGFIAK